MYEDAKQSTSEEQHNVHACTWCSFCAPQGTDVCCVAAQSWCVIAHVAIFNTLYDKAQLKSNTTCTRAQVLQFLRDLQFRRISSARAPWHTSHPSASESQMPQIMQCYEQWIRHVYPYTIILYTVQKQHGTLLIKLPQMPQIILVTPPALTNAKSAC